MKKILVISIITALLMPTTAIARGSSSTSSAGRSSSASRSTTRSTTTTKSTTSSGRSVPSSSKSYNYSGRSVNYSNSYSNFSVSNFILWYFILDSVTKEADKGDGSVRDIYEDQLSAIKDKMKKHEQLPTYEQTVEQMVKVFGNLNISPQEIGATYWHTYAYYGPAPEKKL